MNKDVRWRVYYADGSTFSSLEGEPQDAPGTGVIVIVQRHPDPNENPYIQHMEDYYVWLGYAWLACDLFRLWQYWFVDNKKYDFPRASLGGETIRSVSFEEIRKEAKKDKDFFS